MKSHQAQSQLEQAYHKLFLGIEVNGFGYGIPVECVREIVYQVKLNPLPQTPDFVRGVAVIRDEAIPVLDLNILLGGDRQIKIHDESCYIVIQLADGNDNLTQVCLLADQILQTYKINKNNIDTSPSVTYEKLINYILGVTRIDEHVLVLIEPADLISPLLNTVTPYVTYKDNATLSGKNKSEVEERKAKNRYLSVYVNEEEYAFPLPAISQVINMSSLANHVEEDIPDFLSTAAIYNDRLVVIVRLGDIISDEPRPESTDSDSSRDVIVLVELQSGLMGIAVNHIGQSYDSETDPQTNSFCNDLQRNRIGSLGFIKKEKQDESIEVINPFGVFSNKELITLDAWMKNINRLIQTTNPDKSRDTADENEGGPLAAYTGSYLVVQVGNHLVGLDNRYVDEVLSYDALIPMNNGPRWFPGLLDLRDSTYPVIDIHTKFDLDPAETNEHDRNVLIMIRNNDHKVGLMVKKVMHSIKVTEKELKGSEYSNIYIVPEALNAVADTPEGIVHIIDLANVIEMPEISAERRLRALQQETEQSDSNLLNPQMLTAR